MCDSTVSLLVRSLCPGFARKAHKTRRKKTNKQKTVPLWPLFGRPCHITMNRSAFPVFNRLCFLHSCSPKLANDINIDQTIEHRRAVCCGSVKWSAEYRHWSIQGFVWTGNRCVHPERRAHYCLYCSVEKAGQDTGGRARGGYKLTGCQHFVQRGWVAEKKNLTAAKHMALSCSAFGVCLSLCLRFLSSPAPPPPLHPDPALLSYWLLGEEIW